MESNSIKEIVDGLAARGVITADTRRQLFAIMLQQATDYEKKISLLNEDLIRVRATRDALKAQLAK